MQIFVFSGLQDSMMLRDLTAGF